MRIFEKDYKINFVDEHDVLVGLDSFQSCCEDWGYYFSETPDGNKIEEPSDLEDYFFDQDFFKEVEGPDDWDCDNRVTFRLRACQERELFLHLYNHHNGYYSHGFSMEVGGTTLRKGSL